MDIKIGDKVKSLIAIEAVDMLEEGIVTAITVGHRFPIAVSFKRSWGPMHAYYTEDELTYA